jgi:hypothetical protein
VSGARATVVLAAPAVHELETCLPAGPAVRSSCRTQELFQMQAETCAASLEVPCLLRPGRAPDARVADHHCHSPTVIGLIIGNQGRELQQMQELASW